MQAGEARIEILENTFPRGPGELSANARRSRSSSALRNARVSWAVEFG